MHYPAAKTYHHAYYAGLAYHIVRMLEIGDFICKQRPFLNPDLIKAGIIAAHASDLVPRSFTTLNLDYRQNGLGSNSCGPAQSPEHSIKPEPFSFRILLKAYTSEDTDPAGLSRRMRSEAELYK